MIGTCLSTAELRKVMARFLFVRDCTDLEVHHEAVRLISLRGAIAKAIHKALDQRHEATVQPFECAKDDRALAALWDESLRQGKIPAAYWAVLTHRSASPELSRKAFGDAHMLSHLVGSANQADIRRLVDPEQENAGLRERAEHHRARAQQVLDERDKIIPCLSSESNDAQKCHADWSRRIMLNTLLHRKARSWLLPGLA